MSNSRRRHHRTAMPCLATPFGGRRAQTSGLYLHLPFCRTKCRYCAFNSRVTTAHERQAYLAALHREMERMADHPWSLGQQFDTLFLGGGTPTIYSGEELGHLIHRCLHLFPFSRDTEISIEANPNAVGFEQLSMLLDAGVNRLSLGIQSFLAPELTQIGRSHTPDQAHSAITMARAAGFTNLNLDLIYGLPGQTSDSWQRSLGAALEHNPEHLALYELMLEADTELEQMVRSGRLRLPPEEAIVEMTNITEALLQAGDIERYEISNYARPGRCCRHNLHYWHNHNYLGLGAGAWSSFDGLRLHNTDHPGHYITAITNDTFPYQEGEGLSQSAAFRETVIMGLRLIQGIALTPIEQRFDITAEEVYGPLFRHLIDQGHLLREGDRIRLAADILPVANQILAQLV